MKFSKHKKRERLRPIAAAQRRRLGPSHTILHQQLIMSLRRKLASRTPSPSNSMEGILVCDSSVNQPESEPVLPFPLTKEFIMSLNNYSVTFEDAWSLFDVDLLTFKERLMELNIFVWNEPNGLRVRIHGGDHDITIFFKLLRKYYVVKATDCFSDIINQIENDLNLSPDSYELTYEQPQTSINTLLKTDLDWHYAVESSQGRDYVLLNVKTDAEHIVHYMAAYDEYSSDSDDEK